MGAENALRSRPAGEDDQKDREIKRLKQKVGENDAVPRVSNQMWEEET